MHLFIEDLTTTVATPGSNVQSTHCILKAVYSRKYEVMIIVISCSRHGNRYVLQWLHAPSMATQSDYAAGSIALKIQAAMPTLGSRY